MGMQGAMLETAATEETGTRGSQRSLILKNLLCCALGLCFVRQLGTLLEFGRRMDGWMRKMSE